MIQMKGLKEILKYFKLKKKKKLRCTNSCWVQTAVTIICLHQNERRDITPDPTDKRIVRECYKKSCFPKFNNLDKTYSLQDTNYQIPFKKKSITRAARHPLQKLSL